jgi:hypothetical protein
MRKKILIEGPEEGFRSLQNSWKVSFLRSPFLELRQMLAALHPRRNQQPISRSKATARIEELPLKAARSDHETKLDKNADK